VGRRRRDRRLQVAERDQAFAIEYWPLERASWPRHRLSGELAGKIALVTGGASGIGRAAARVLASRGAHVVVADLNVDGAQEVADEIVDAQGFRRAIAVEVDVTREDAVQAVTDRAVLEYGGIDILVASAGLATSAPITETTLEDWERNYAVLARGYFLAARETFRVCASRAAAARSSSSPRRTPSSRGPMPPRTRRRRRHRSTSPAAWRRRAGPRASA
jgi:NAD(P)-dependent dehydrogenase (short-subunit alcohol dehydrogenase family)